ncbi:MAG: nucleotidyl transferase AbiEii/AbiGii toxin family protein [Candidatus Omnitrophota bacterium]|nr:nucleotidyl transferase AbiEii/AbiGii toxin family protein [Candidatus Omnitrophota bacterium]
MAKIMYSSLQMREIFHLEFLRWMARKVKAERYALKGGANLRFFFNSFRYSEDMDLDVFSVRVDMLKDIVMQILSNQSFQDMLKPFGIGRLVNPDMAKAKQTETTQRFKVHLITTAGEDLFTKVEFSRRSRNEGKSIVEPVSDTISRLYKLPPLLMPHYNIESAIIQKIRALSDRTVLQARDIFDLYVLSSQYKPVKTGEAKIDNERLAKAREGILEIGFEQFRDTVVSYLSFEDQAVYNNSSSWGEIKLKALNFIDEYTRVY